MDCCCSRALHSGCALCLSRAASTLFVVCLLTHSSISSNRRMNQSINQSMAHAFTRRAVLASLIGSTVGAWRTSRAALAHRAPPNIFRSRRSQTQCSQSSCLARILLWFVFDSLASIVVVTTRFVDISVIRWFAKCKNCALQKRKQNQNQKQIQIQNQNSKTKNQNQKNNNQRTQPWKFETWANARYNY